MTMEWAIPSTGVRERATKSKKEFSRAGVRSGDSRLGDLPRPAQR
jgi:hypothetical protein